MKEKQKQKDLLSIGEAAEFLDVSVKTLRRWDSSGKLKAVKSSGGHRYYPKEELERFISDLPTLARNWAESETVPDLSSDYHCRTQDIFVARIDKMDILIDKDFEEENNLSSLITVVAGEIGNNSFDHNFGNWPDVPGVFFAYDRNKRIIVLADRGVGIRETLSRVKPDLKDDKTALKVAFNEHISGRSPEKRGNGLKLVKSIAVDNEIGISLQSGKAVARISKNDGSLEIDLSKRYLRGTLAIINY